MDRRKFVTTAVGVGLVGATGGCLDALEEEAKTAKEEAESKAEMAVKYGEAYAKTPDTIEALDQAVTFFEEQNYEDVLSETDFAIDNAETMNEGFQKAKELAVDEGIEKVENAATTGIEMTNLIDTTATGLADAAKAMQNDSVQQAQEAFETAKADLQEVKTLRDELLTEEDVKDLV